MEMGCSDKHNFFLFRKYLDYASNAQNIYNDYENGNRKKFGEIRKSERPGGGDSSLTLV